MIISAGAQAWLNRVIFSNRVLVWFGLISFPLYLWHWPLLSFAHIIEGETLSREIRIAIVLLSIALAWLTYKLIEQPLRFGSTTWVKPAALCVLMVFIGYVGFNTSQGNGLTFRQKSMIQHNTQFDWLPSYKRNAACEHAYPDLASGHCLRAKASEPTILVLGDSHSNSLYPGMVDAMANTRDNVANFSKSGCLPFFDLASVQKGEQKKCPEYSNSALTFAEENPSVHTVVLSSRGPLYLTGKGYGGNGEVTHERTISLVKRREMTNSHQIFAMAMKTTIERLLAKNKRIIFVLDWPELGFDPKSCVDSRPLRFSNHVREPCAVSRLDFEQRNRQYRELVLSVLKDFPSVDVFDAAALFCDAQWCWAMTEGKMLYRDDDHLSVQGSRYVASALVKLLKPWQE